MHKQAMRFRRARHHQKRGTLRLFAPAMPCPPPNRPGQSSRPGRCGTSRTCECQGGSRSAPGSLGTAYLKYYLGLARGEPLLGLCKTLVKCCAASRYLRCCAVLCAGSANDSARFKCKIPEHPHQWPTSCTTVKPRLKLAVLPPGIVSRSKNTPS